MSGEKYPFGVFSSKSIQDKCPTLHYRLQGDFFYIVRDSAKQPGMLTLDYKTREGGEGIARFAYYNNDWILHSEFLKSASGIFEPLRRADRSLPTKEVIEAHLEQNLDLQTMDFTSDDVKDKFYSAVNRFVSSKALPPITDTNFLSPQEYDTTERNAHKILNDLKDALMASPAVSLEEKACAIKVAQSFIEGYCCSCITLEPVGRDAVVMPSGKVIDRADLIKCGYEDPTSRHKVPEKIKGTDVFAELHERVTAAFASLEVEMNSRADIAVNGSGGAQVSEASRPLARDPRISEAQAAVFTARFLEMLERKRAEKAAKSFGGMGV